VAKSTVLQPFLLIRGRPKSQRWSIV